MGLRIFSSDEAFQYDEIILYQILFNMSNSAIITPDAKDSSIL